MLPTDDKLDQSLCSKPDEIGSWLPVALRSERVDQGRRCFGPAPKADLRNCLPSNYVANWLCSAYSRRIMRFFLILSVLCFGFMTGSAYAQVDARSIVEGCHDVVRASRGLVPQGKNETGGECLGAVSAVQEHLDKLHHLYYLQRFPNFDDSFKGKDKLDTLNAYISSIIMFGPNACFPTGGRVGDLAAAVDRYAQAHPQEVTGGAYEFVAHVFDIEYGCQPHPRL